MSNFWDSDPVAAPTAAPKGANFWEADPIAASTAPKLSDAITDIPHEVGKTANSNLEAITNVANRGSKGPIEGLMDTGRAVGGIAGLIASPITGAFRSLIGHPMAQAEHYAGTKIAPEIAAKDDPQEMYNNAAGDVETALSAARPAGAPIKVPTAGPKLGGYDWQSPTAAAPVPQSPDLKRAARDIWNGPAIKNMNIPSQDVANLGSMIENDLTTRGFRPTAGNAPDTFAEIKNLTPGQGVQAVKVDDLRSARRALNIAAGKRDPLTGTPLPDANAATKAIGHVDNFLDNLAPELKTANANYAAAKSSDRLDYRLAKAEHRAARSGTGGNIENVMRQEADKIPDRGLTPDEQSMRDRIVLGSTTRNALRTAGKLGVDGGLSLMLHTGAALGSGGATVPVTIAGTVARKVGEMLTRGEMARLNETIRARSPLAKVIAARQITQLPGVGQGALGGSLISQGIRLPQIPMSVLPANADQSQ